MQDKARYTRLAVILHWLTAALVIANVLMIWVVDSLPDAAQRPVIDLHKSFGITVLGLACLRVLWRYANPPPAMPADYKPWERRAAHAVHYALYALIFLLPLSGWVHDSAWDKASKYPLSLYGFIPWFRFGFIEHMDPAAKQHLHDVSMAVHAAAANVLYALFALHIAGALKHQLLDRRPELQRMLPAK